jgi:hypothetical protein
MAATGHRIPALPFLPMASAMAGGDDGHDAWTRSGTALKYLLPATALALSFQPTKDDESMPDPPDIDAVASGLNWPGPCLDRSAPANVAIALLRAEISSELLKRAIDARRPNGGPHAFPSGHATTAFMGAESIRQQRGWRWGIPAFALASWVGYTRVDARAHHWRDVIAGAAIGIAANHDFGSFDTSIGRLSIAPTLLSDAEGRIHGVPGLWLEFRF